MKSSSITDKHVGNTFTQEELLTNKFYPALFKQNLSIGQYQAGCNTKQK